MTEPKRQPWEALADAFEEAGVDMDTVTLRSMAPFYMDEVNPNVYRYSSGPKAGQEAARRINGEWRYQ